jgi:hypothetical protein
MRLTDAVTSDRRPVLVVDREGLAQTAWPVPDEAWPVPDDRPAADRPGDLGGRPVASATTTCDR